MQPSFLAMTKGGDLVELQDTAFAGSCIQPTRVSTEASASLNDGADSGVDAWHSRHQYQASLSLQVSILSSPSEWPAEAARVQQKAAENQGNALTKMARLKVQPQPQAGQAQPDAQAGAAATEDDGSLAKDQGLDSGEEELPLLERKRQANIKRNKQANSPPLISMHWHTLKPWQTATASPGKNTC